MPTYLLKIIRRDPGSSSAGRKMTEANFQAPNDDEARLEAQRQANQLSPEHFVTLVNDQGDVVWVTDPHPKRP